ncbi:MAG: TonB-dependent receptor [Acidobacteriota bacterium]
MRTNRTLARATLLALAAGLLLASGAFAQAPTGNVTGKVVDPDGAPLPGVTVTGESPNLQGARVVVTGADGGFKLAFLRPGNYKVTYELEGFSTAVQEVVVSGAQDKSVGSVTLSLAAEVEEIVVTGALETISEGTGAETTYSIDEIDDLPVARNIRSATLLTPGVAATGPKQSGSRQAPLSISGAMSFESLYLVNGVVVNENLRGQSLDLFIEDAIQEFTAVTSGASAEYGRFTGGVINVLTKSGGNDFSGSYRRSFTQDDWSSETDFFEEPLDDTLNEREEITIGGPFWKDHLWFFGAYRDIGDNSQNRTTAAPTSISYNRVATQERLEGKLTLTPHPSHSIVANYLEIEATTTNSSFGQVLDLDSLSDRSDPQDLKAGHYTGIFGSNFFAEAQYSERAFELGVGSGSQSLDLIDGTVIQWNGPGSRYGTGTFCGVCGGELRDNENTLAKGSYFLSTEGSGSHDIVFGYDTFTDVRQSDNKQSGSDFIVWHGNDPIFQGNDIFPVFGAGTAQDQFDWIVWFPILEGSLGTDFTTNSLYVNDSWQLNDRWSFNLGLRYDENDGVDAEGKQVADDSRISPRLGATYDVKGDGDLIVNASLGRYVAGINNGAADQTSAAGTPAIFAAFYGGPSINAGGGPLLTQEEALAVVFDWWTSNGGLTSPDGDLSALPGLFFADIPGATTVIDTTLDSPYVDELSVGFTKRIGNKGLFRADVVLREFGDFYAQRTTTDTGQITIDAGTFDRTLVYNEDDLLERDYKGLHTQFRYRATDRLTLAGNYVLSNAEGNFNGETAGSGAVNGTPLNYPEYREARWNTPVGDLTTDQRHRLNLWAVYSLLDTDRHSLNGSALVRYASGTPYSLVASIDPRPFVTNPGYLTPPSAMNYFIGGRGSLETDDITTLDLSLNYSFKWNMWNRGFEIFVQPEILNVLDEQGFVSVDNTVDNLAPFNPFTETPVEGVNFERGDDFGNPQVPEDINLPRTFRVSVGVRF